MPDPEPVPESRLTYQLRRFAVAGLVVWVVAGAAFVVSATTGVFGLDRLTGFWASADHIALRVWVACLAGLIIIVLTAVGRRGSGEPVSTVSADRWAAFAAVTGFAAWILGGILLSTGVSGIPGGSSTPIVFLEVVGFRVAIAAFAWIVIRRSRAWLVEDTPV